MLFPTLIAGGFSLIMASAPEAVAEQVAKVQERQPVAVVVAERARENVFPTEAMAEQFDAYLAWTKEQGLSRLAAFEQLSDEQIHYSPNLSAEMPLPTAEMAEQFAAYLRWTREQQLSRFYAFQATDFD